MMQEGSPPGTPKTSSAPRSAPGRKQTPKPPRARREERAREKAEAEAQEQQREREEMKDAAQIASRVQAIRSGRRPGVAKYVVLGVIVALGAMFAYFQFVPIDTAFYEQLAGQKLGQPVKIGAAKFSWLPSPGLQFSNVIIGADQGVKIDTVTAIPELSSLVGETRQLKSVLLHGVTLAPAGLAAVLWGKLQPAGGSMAVGDITAQEIKTSLEGLTLPPLSAKITLGKDGSVAKIGLTTPDKLWEADIVPTAGRAEIELAAGSLQGVLGIPFKLENFSGKGSVTSNELLLNQYDGKVLNGVVRGKARLRWGAAWTLDGDVSARQIDAVQLAPKLFQDGTLEGEGVFSLAAPTADKLFARPRLDGTFVVHKGVLMGVDLPRMINAATNAGGSTQFTELRGRAAVGAGRVALRELRMSAGFFGASGTIDVDPAGSLSGSVHAEMRNPSGGVSSANVALTGNTDRIAVKR